MNAPESNVIISKDINRSINEICSDIPFDKLFIITDNNTERCCLPLIEDNDYVKDAIQISLPAGEENKNLDNVVKIWSRLTISGAKRNSLIINLGGGVISDIGGFAASCFKRGVRFINIPTTLLSQVDASAGGKTGFNFAGYKNEIGTFTMPEKVIISTDFLKTLEHRDFISGYAEMIKHALISDENYLAKIISFDLNHINYPKLSALIEESIKIKQHIVEQDPYEKSIRKVLNFGHTIGHAIESYSLEQSGPLLHGEAVALGLIGELYLSCKMINFPVGKYETIRNYILSVYNNLDCTNIEDRLVDLMLHDKKNTAESINFTLLKDVGVFKIDNFCDRDEIVEALTQC